MQSSAMTTDKNGKELHIGDTVSLTLSGIVVSTESSPFENCIDISTDFGALTLLPENVELVSSTAPETDFKTKPEFLPR